MPRCVALAALPALAAVLGAAVYIAARPVRAGAAVRGFTQPVGVRSRDAGLPARAVLRRLRTRRHSSEWGSVDGRQKLFYLPEAHTDFILAVISEELGLIGVLVVLGAFAALLVAGVQVALRSRQRFAMLVSFGMTGLLTVPALINAAVVMGVAPTKGLTLPLLSYGRSSLIVSCVAVGVLLGIALRQAPAERTAVKGADPRGLVQA